MPDVVLGDRFRQALDFAAEVHADQRRKGGEIPYLGHLLAVAATVIEAGGSEDTVIAALLHDTLEDHPDRVSAGDLAERFGPEVARIVGACSDTTVHPKPPWRARKEAYLARLGTEDEAVLLVSLADKLHNVTALRRDLEAHGAPTWQRFNAGPAEQLWYYQSLLAVFRNRLAGTDRRGLVHELADQVAHVERLAGAATP